MHTQIAKTNSFPTISTFIKFLLIVPLTLIVCAQDFNAFGADGKEKDPLLPKDRISINGGNHGGELRRMEEGDGGQLRPHVDLRVSFPPIPFDETLLDAVAALNFDQIVITQDLSEAVAEAEMNKITEYLAYMSGDADYIEGVVEQARAGGYYNENVEQFKIALRERAWTAATEGPLASFLGVLVGKIDIFQKQTSALQGQNTLRQNELVRLRTIIEKLQNGFLDYRRRSQQLEENRAKLAAELERVRSQPAPQTHPVSMKAGVGSKYWWLTWLGIPIGVGVGGVIGALIAHFYIK